MSVYDAPRNGVKGAAAASSAASPRTRHVCPFCGTLNTEAEGLPCIKCTLINTPQTRRVTKGRIGPWYVLQPRNPSSPGMKLDVLVGFVHKGQVTARSIVRGPTTHQFWKYAAHVKGLSREFGLCHSCGADIATESIVCAHCGKSQEPPEQPDALLEPLTPVRPSVLNANNNGSLSGVVIPLISSEPPTVPEMVDAEVVEQDSSHEPARPTTRVVIEPMVEPSPPLAEPEPEEDPFGHVNGNGHAHTTTDGHATSRGSEPLDGERVIGSPDPRTSTSTELMSPADLAAAFHLKFAPVAEFNHQPVVKRSHWKMWTTLTVLVLLAVGGVLVWIYMPAQRDTTVQWLGKQYESAKAWSSSSTAP
jgi:hypothetical protein